MLVKLTGQVLKAFITADRNYKGKDAWMFGEAFV
jgi:hypothetical protein